MRRPSVQFAKAAALKRLEAKTVTRIDEFARAMAMYSRRSRQR